jgi:ABC-type transport system substrate-binding protein
MISSVHNKRVAKAIRLKKRAMREKDRRFLVEGAQAVFESIASGARVREVFHTTPDQRIAPAIDAALDAVKNTVDFVAVRHAMETFQKIYVEKTIEIPLFFRGELDAVSPKVGNFAANPTSAGPTWNAVDWYLKG